MNYNHHVLMMAKKVPLSYLESNKVFKVPYNKDGTEKGNSSNVSHLREMWACVCRFKGGMMTGNNSLNLMTAT